LVVVTGIRVSMGRDECAAAVADEISEVVLVVVIAVVFGLAVDG